MRVLCFVLAALMMLFVVVQFNDPDGPKWMVIYGIPALFALLCGFRPRVYHSPVLRGVLLLCMLAAIGGMIYYWPKSEAWWTQEVWWEVETAREGMGMMIIVVVLALIFAAQHQIRRKLPPAS